MMRLSPRSAALCAAFALAASAVSAQSLPGGGDTRSSGLGGLLNGLSSFTQKESPEEEARSGEDIAAPVLGAAPPWKNSIVQRYVNLVGRRVADQAERRDVAWRFAVIDSPSINAMAFPGGIVVVTRGLYALLDTEDELAAVLGHEIAHVNRKHQWKVIRQQKLVALAEGRITGKDASKTSKLVADLGAKLIARGLDKSAEFEADRDGAVLAIGTAVDNEAIADIQALAPALINLAGKTDLFELAEWFRRCAVVVTNDSGPMHLAAAVGTPVVAIFGPTDPALTGPYGVGHSVLRVDLPCAPCFQDRCTQPNSMACMNGVSVAEVLQAVQKFV